MEKISVKIYVIDNDNILTYYIKKNTYDNSYMFINNVNMIYLLEKSNISNYKINIIKKYNKKFIIFFYTADDILKQQLINIKNIKFDYISLHFFNEYINDMVIKYHIAILNIIL